MSEETINTHEEVKVAPAIYRAIAGVIEDIGTVGKDKINKQQGFKYRSIDDVYNALHPALAKNKVFIVPEILEHERTDAGKSRNGASIVRSVCRIKYTLYGEDGSSVESVIVGEALDMADKAINKCMAIAYKYLCFQVFCIPTEEMLDPDGETIEPEPWKQQAKKSEQKKQEPPKQEKESTPDPTSVKVTDIMVKTMNAELDRTGLSDAVLFKLFNVSTLNEMNVAQFQKAMKKFEMTPNKKEAEHE